jgi:hypothetical protein
LGKAKHFVEEDPVTLLRCGKLYPVDKAYERVNTKNDRPLDRTDKVFINFFYFRFSSFPNISILFSLLFFQIFIIFVLFFFQIGLPPSDDF